MTLPALPEGSHLLHIGPQKTGSTALQWALHHGRRSLREHGVVYPGPGPRIREAAEYGLGFRRDDGQTARRQAWRRLLRQVNNPDALRVCISHEAFGRADDDQIRRIVEELGGSEPHVVLAARRYDGLMPSQWQQRVKTRVTLSYDEWLHSVLDEEAPHGPVWRNVWVPHDTVRLLERWSAVVGPDRVTLIVADDRDRELLPSTFEQLLGLPPGLIDMSAAGQTNVSLTYPQVELLRRVNLGFAERGWTGGDYHRLVRLGFVHAIMNAPRPVDDPRIPPLPGWARDRLVELSDRRIEGLRTAPVRIVGDLESLRVAGPTGALEDAAAPATHVTLETAALALIGMAEAAIERNGPEGPRRRTAGEPDAEPT